MTCMEVVLAVMRRIGFVILLAIVLLWWAFR